MRHLSIVLAGVFALALTFWAGCDKGDETTEESGGQAGGESAGPLRLPPVDQMAEHICQLLTTAQVRELSGMEVADGELMEVPGMSACRYVAEGGAVNLVYMVGGACENFLTTVESEAVEGPGERAAYYATDNNMIVMGHERCLQAKVEGGDRSHAQALAAAAWPGVMATGSAE